MSRAISKSDLFARLGYGPPYDGLEAVLEQGGLSRAAKPNIAQDKSDRVAELLSRSFLAVCGRGDCRAEAEMEAAAARPARQVIPAATQADCELCGGSATGRAVDRMVAAWQRANLARLVVVGGSPNARQDLAARVAGRLELRLVEGTGSRTLSDAHADVAWADRVALWGGTQLDHGVSNLYRGPKVVQFARRGVAALAQEMTETATR